ncbi:Spliceosome-associated protein 49 [Sarracenia purpurea var. burkii]
MVYHGVGIREQGNLAKDDAHNIPDEFYIGTCGVKRGLTKEAYLRRNPYSAKVNTTIFIDNIPDQIDNTWLRNAFNLCGLVAGAFIPNKRRRMSNSRFGFVKFRDPKDTSAAIHNYNGVRWFDKFIRVSKAWFDLRRRNNETHPSYNKAKHKRVQGANNISQVSSSSLDPIDKVGAEDFVGCIETTVVDEEWTKSCAMGIIRDIKLLVSVQDAMIEEGVLDIIVKPMGGLKALPHYVILMSSGSLVCMKLVLGENKDIGNSDSNE